MEKTESLKEMIRQSRRICVFTGAGISCPSGIPDFRSAKGIYSQKTGYTYSPEEMISHSFFLEHPEEFYEFYRSKMLYPEAKPNAAHRYFADLEKQGKEVSVVTQNIDGLHQDAGSTNVMELHGSVRRNYCMKCGAFYDGNFVAESSGIPRCPKDGGTVKPDVVLYEESLDGEVIERAVEAIRKADLMIVVGTSLVVYPAASFVRYFRGNHLVLINQSETAYDSAADLVFHEDVTEVVRRLKI